jgi:hypothetical protein
MTAQEIVDLLNEAFDLDPAAVQAMLGLGVPCNAELAAHPTIPMGEKYGGKCLSVMGLLRGIAALDGAGIEAVADSEGFLEGFVVAREPSEAVA